MRFVTGEVAPLAPLLIPVGEILVWSVALAFCLLSVYIAKAFFGTATSLVGWIPLFGKVATHSLTSIEQKIVSFLSGAANSADAKMGAAFHQLARVVDWLGEEIARHANLLVTLAQLVAGQNLFGLLTSSIRQILARVRIVQSTADAALRRIDLAEKRLAHGIGADVLPRVRSLEQDIAHVVEHDIAGLRARERALEDGALNTFRWIRSHPLALATTAFVGAVAIALGRMGMGWLRCNSATQLGKKYGCSLWGHLEQLLPLGIFLTVAFDFEDFCKAARVVAAGLGDGVAAIEGVFDPHLPPLPPPRG